MPYPVHNLIEGRGEPVCAQPDDQLQDALALMIENDFSQLPVVDESGRPLGMVTTDSIPRALSHFGARVEDLLVSDVTVSAPEHTLDSDLFELLDRLRDSNAILVVDGNRRLIGIVTSFDAMEYFRQRAEDMMRVEDIEGMIKDLVLTAFVDEAGDPDENKLAEAIGDITSSGKQLRKNYRKALQLYLGRHTAGDATINPEWFDESFSHLAPTEPPRDFDRLTLYEYAELLLDRRHWEFYEPILKLKRESLRKLLDGVRETRNALAHFRGEISATSRDQLRFCAEWLARHPVGIPVGWPTPVAGTPPEHAQVRETAAAYTKSVDSDGVAPTEEEIGPRESRYTPLGIWLRGQSADEKRIQLSFEDVEEIIAGSLPESARSHRAWWANDSVSHVQSQQWLDAGWRVSTVNLLQEKVVFSRVHGRELAYLEFFTALDKDFRKKAVFPVIDRFPQGTNWYRVFSLPTTGNQMAQLVFAFSHGKRFRVELYIDCGDKDRNKSAFDELHAQQTEIEAQLGASLSWERIGNRVASRIALYRPGAITDSPEKLGALRVWAIDAMNRFYEAVATSADEVLQSV